MKTIIITFLVTVVFIVAMGFIENKRTQNLNKLNLEYQQALQDLSITDSVITNTNDDEEEETSNISVTISGAVSKTGTYTFTSPSYLSDLLDKAVLLETADEEAFNINYLLVNNDDIYIPYTNNGNKISINSADVATLDLLPGIGSTLANRIVEYREENGEFELLEQLKKINGLGDSAFNKIKDYIKL